MVVHGAQFNEGQSTALKDVSLNLFSEISLFPIYISYYFILRYTNMDCCGGKW